MRPNGPSGWAVRRRRPAVMVRGVGTAAVTAAGEMHGFPAALASFIGRAGARREVAGLLGEYRLVTVTGPGGAGKTRLAGQVARQVARRFSWDRRDVTHPYIYAFICILSIATVIVNCALSSAQGPRRASIRSECRLP
jgi:hypothetical protein